MYIVCDLPCLPPELSWPMLLVMEMIAKVAPDGTVVAVPNQVHVEAGLACIEQGVPIIVEKPIADTVAEALRLVEAAEAAGVATLTGHHRRHNPIMRRAAELVRDGAVGKVVAATSVWLAHKLNMTNFRDRRISTMKTERVTMNVGVDDTLLTQRTLTDGAFREKKLRNLRTLAR